MAKPINARICYFAVNKSAITTAFSGNYRKRTTPGSGDSSQLFSVLKSNKTKSNILSSFQCFTSIVNVDSID